MKESERTAYASERALKSSKFAGSISAVDCKAICFFYFSKNQLSVYIENVTGWHLSARNR